MEETMVQAYNMLKVEIMVTDLEGKILFANNYLCECFQKKYEDIQGRSIFNFVLPEERKILITAFNDFLKNGENKLDKIKIIVDEKIHFFEIKSTLNSNEVIHVLRDITEKREGENDLIRKKEFIETMNKILSHDLTNNFSVILSALRILHRLDPDGIDKHEEIVSAIEKESRKGISIINRIRGLRSTIENEQNLRIYNLKDVIRSVSNQSSIFIEVYGEGKALADSLLPNIFENIFNNAIKHGEAGKIEITIEEKVKEQKTIVKIKNDGDPIEKEILHHIFQEGVKSEKTGNTGIGLSIVQKTIQRYGGNIKVKNLEEGVCFTLEFQML
jgi:PAS domain S-box-containing protein